MRRFRSVLVLVTTVSFLCTSLTLPANAAVLSTGDYLSAGARQADMQTVTAALQREDVRGYLVRMGVDPDNALARVAQLPDEDVARIAEQMEELPAGGSILALIGAVFVVLLILELTGVINIFNKA
ncbi:MAG TPA: PA2779 family protein [Pseudomonadales bacterium]